MESIKEVLELKSVGCGVFAAVLSGLCSALWFVLAFRHGGAVWSNWFIGVVWLIAMVTWGLRAYRVHKYKEKEEETS